MPRFFKFCLFFFIVCLLGLPLSFLFQKTSSPERPYLSVIGTVRMGDGIGRQAVELMDTLLGEVSIGFIPTARIHYRDVPERVRPLLENPCRTLGKLIIYEEPLPTPNRKFYRKLTKNLKGPKNKDQVRIAYSMFEASRIPKQWATALNLYFDAVAVPDEFLVEVYQESGVQIPIFVLPLGLEIDSFLNQPLKSGRHTPFCFINNSSLIPRKNPEALITAFNLAFGNNPDVELKINVRYSVGTYYDQIRQLIASLGANNIHLTKDWLDNAGYLNFFLKGDAFVSLTKGEGFSIQPREAMALGMPVVISENTAHKTIIKTGLANAVACPHVQPAYNAFLKKSYGNEYLADIDAAAEALKKVYQDYDDELSLAATRRKWAATYRFENLKPLYISLVKPAKITLGDENIITPEGIVTNSPELFQKLKSL